jgi:hypothetical protein
MTFTRRWAELMAEQGGPGVADLRGGGPVELQWWSDIVHEDDGRIAFGVSACTLDEFTTRADALGWLPPWRRLAGRKYGGGVLMMCCAQTGDVVGGPWEVGG